MNSFIKKVVSNQLACEWLIATPMVVVCVTTYAYWITAYYGDPRWWTMVMALLGPFAIFPMAVGFPIALTIRFLKRKYGII